MKRWICLFITIILLAGLAPVDPPQKVAFRLADGVRISGEITSFDHESLDGSFGRRDWLDLHSDDIWAIYRKVMDRDSAEQWIALGRLMTIVAGDDQSAKAQRAFSEALKVDKNVQSRIDQARQEAISILVKREQAAAKGKAGVLSPEAGPFDPTPWPRRTDQERAEATLSLRAKAEALLKAAGGSGYEVIESDYFVVFADVPRLQAAQWGWTLDQAVKRLLALLNLPRDTPLFDAKAAVFIFESRQVFAALEKDAFAQVVPEKLRSITHYQDGGIFINIHRPQDEAELTDTLAMQAVLAALHRHHSAVRLPAWANEGLAAHVASLVQPKSASSLNRQRDGLKFIRSGRRLDAVIAADYPEDAFLNEQQTIQAVGELLVDLMIRERSEKFAAWVLAVKSGKAWSAALTEDFGIPPSRFFSQAAAHYTVND